jgi:hypothetical protein
MADQRSAESDAVAAARDFGREKLETAKGRLADGADRVADAAERVAKSLESETGDNKVSELGRNLAGMIRQLAGGTREHDIEMIARELGDLARRKPGVFLAGSVALGFGLARFLKARPGQTAASGYGYGEPRRDRGFDAEDALDMSEAAQRRGAQEARGDAWSVASDEPYSSTEDASTLGGTEHEHDR